MCMRMVPVLLYGYETYEQEPIDESKLGPTFKFVKEEMEVKVLS